MVRKAFENCGISIRPDGSQIDRISIKDIPKDSISFEGWEAANQDDIWG